MLKKVNGKNEKKVEKKNIICYIVIRFFDLQRREK